jgi:hypothetical protein
LRLSLQSIIGATLTRRSIEISCFSLGSIAKSPRGSWSSSMQRRRSNSCAPRRSIALSYGVS